MKNMIIGFLVGPFLLMAGLGAALTGPVAEVLGASQRSPPAVGSRPRRGR
ncbi:MAG: hypothetical protein M0Z30_10195 [Actinomycetota bacterium]|nr:hypothetical protein [Actinomycetota bacterium]